MLIRYKHPLSPAWWGNTIKQKIAEISYPWTFISSEHYILYVFIDTAKYHIHIKFAFYYGQKYIQPKIIISYMSWHWEVSYLYKPCLLWSIDKNVYSKKLIMQTTSRKLINISTTTIKMTDFSITYLSKGQLYPLCGLFFLLFIYWLDIDFFFSWCSIFRFFLVSSSDLFVSFMALATCLISPHHPGLILYSHRE